MEQHWPEALPDRYSMEAFPDAVVRRRDVRPADLHRAIACRVVRQRVRPAAGRGVRRGFAARLLKAASEAQAELLLSPELGAMLTAGCLCPDALGRPRVEAGAVSLPQAAEQAE